ncbi:MAG: (2Fe-2S)-binding protein [Acidobacteria bacterium]|nr:(2Fe-2S)-binding protein [Acidobacteriota bacterium]
MAEKKDPKKSKPQAGISRRGFFKGVGAGVITTSVPSLLKAAPQRATGPGAVPVRLMVNGRERTLNIEPRVTLLNALRDHLDLTGAKKVCDRGACGACTVIMDGRTVYACSILAIEAQGHKIETVESLAANGQMHPVQAAFVNNDAHQCGFCTPGFVVACKGFLDANPNPTREQVLRGLGGNLCRCGTYVGVTAAVLEAAATMRGGRNG